MKYNWKSLYNSSDRATQSHTARLVL